MTCTSSISWPIGNRQFMGSCKHSGALADRLGPPPLVCDEKKKGETGSGVSLRDVCVRENDHENARVVKNHMILATEEIKRKRERKFMSLANNR